jgi:hypothetical protein
MDAQNKFKIMAETSHQLVEMIQKRLGDSISTLDSLTGSPMENIPDEVKKMREIEASRIRAVMQEQKSIINIINALFPSVG